MFTPSPVLPGSACLWFAGNALFFGLLVSCWANIVSKTLKASICQHCMCVCVCVCMWERERERRWPSNWILEWWKGSMENYQHGCALLSNVWLFATPWTVALQAHLSMGFPRQEYWGGLPFTPPGDLPNSWIESTSLVSPALAGEFSTTVLPGKPSVRFG